jgi:hypothetical protein
MAESIGLVGLGFGLYCPSRVWDSTPCLWAKQCFILMSVRDTPGFHLRK